MAWKIEFDASVPKDLKRISKPEQKKILDFIKDRIAPLDDPRSTGRALKGSLGGLWRYRVGKYRIICRIEDEQLTILVIALSHRKGAYN